MPLSKQLVIEEIKEEIEQFFETNESRTIMFQNLWGAAKTKIKVKYSALNAYVINRKRKISY